MARVHRIVKLSVVDKIQLRNGVQIVCDRVYVVVSIWDYVVFTICNMPFKSIPISAKLCQPYPTSHSHTVNVVNGAKAVLLGHLIPANANAFMSKDLGPSCSKSRVSLSFASDAQQHHNT